MAVYTYTSGLESDIVGLYANELLSSLATRTINSFTRNTAAGLFAFISSEERRTYVYEPSLIDLYNELDFGLITAAYQSTTNHGSITDLNATQEDYGRIYYVTNLESFGFVKCVGEASWKATQAWQGSGNIALFGKEDSPAFWNYLVSDRIRGLDGQSDSMFSSSQLGGGELSLLGNSAIGISLLLSGSGNLFSIGTKSEASTKIYSAEDLRIVFKFSGGIEAESTTQIYHGFGDLFTFSSSQEVTTYDYVGSGSLFGFNNLEESRTYRYTCDYSINYFEEYDYGLITGCSTSSEVSGIISGDTPACEVIVTEGSTAIVDLGQIYRVDLPDNTASEFIDYGFVSEAADANLDYGYIYVTSNLVPCGLFRFSESAASLNKFTPNWIGSGGFRFIGETVLPLNVSVRGTGFFSVLGGSAQTSSVSEASTGLFRISGQTEVGITAITVGEGDLFAVSGSSESVGFNPPDITTDLKLSGTLLSEKITQLHIGSGNLFTLQSATESSVYSYIGSGNLFAFNKLEESRTYVYDCESIIPFTDLNYGLIVDRNNLTISSIGTTIISTDTNGTSGAIRIDNGSTVTIAPGATYTIPNQLTVPQNFEDYGLVSELHDPVRDYGWILGTIQDGMPGCIYGQLDITGVSENQYVARWVADPDAIKITGVARIPLEARYIGDGSIKKFSGAAEVVAFSDAPSGLFDITGFATIGVTAITVGEGNLFAFSGSSESAGFNPPDITTDIRITGTLGNPLLTYNNVGSGNLFAIAGGQESTSYDYVGSGKITLLPRKPQTYELSELANYTLEAYEICNPYINLGNIDYYSGHTKLGCVQLRWLSLEESHEKHTEVYDLGLCKDEPEIDYGFIVDSSVITVSDLFGSISSSVSSTSGAIRVPLGTTLEIESGITYTIIPQLLQASDFEEYGLVAAFADNTRDYGHILEGTGLICPFGVLGLINGSATESFTPTSEIGSGTIKFTDGVGANIFFTPPYIVEGFIGTIYGDGITLFSLLHPGSGNLSYFGGSAETLTFSPDEEQVLFFFRGAAVPIFSLAHFGSGTISISEGDERARVLAPPVGGSISNISGSAHVALSANPPEDQILFRFTGEKEESFSTEYFGQGDLFTFDGSSVLVTLSEQPLINIIISGSSDNTRARKFRGSGGLFGFIGTSFSRTIDLPAFRADIKFFGSSAESFIANPPEQGTEIKLSGDTTPQILTFAEQPFGTIFAFGESTNAFVPNHIGTGSLFAFAGAAESVGFNPPDITTDLKFSGTVTEVFSANPPEKGTEIKLSGDTTPQILTFAEQPFGTVSVFGDAATDRTRSFIGSGSIRKFSGAAESLTFNPEERDMLFSFTGGVSSEKHTEVYVGIDTPIRIRRGALSDFQTYDYQPEWTGSGVVKVNGTVGIRWVPNNVGSGNIFTIGGSSESVTFNPDENQILFSFTGELGESVTNTHVGSGSLFGINGATESATVVPEVAADIKFFGNSTDKLVVNNIGSGNIFAFAGSAESVSFNPDERQLLFSFSGQLVESFGAAETKQIEVDVTGDGLFIRSFAHEGSGSVSVFGESFNRFVVNNIGFGNIFAISGSAESITFNPDENQILFSFTGELTERILVREISKGGTLRLSGTVGNAILTFAEQPEIQVSISGDGYITSALRHVGSGSLFAFSGGSESTAVAPQTKDGLFKFVGSGTEKNTENYVGTGYLRKLSGSSESVSFNPDERQLLFSFNGTRKSEKTTSREISKGGIFSISGESKVLVTLAHEGQGIIPVDGDAHTTRARDFIGFGTIPVFRGAAESLTFNPDERDLLFSFNGERISEKSTFREVGTLGKVRITGTSGDPLLTFAEQPFVKIIVTGDSVDVRSRNYVGTGTLFSFSNAKEKLGRAPYQGSGTIDITGNAFIQVELFQPPRTFVWII